MNYPNQILLFQSWKWPKISTFLVSIAKHLSIKVALLPLTQGYSLNCFVNVFTALFLWYWYELFSYFIIWPQMCSWESSGSLENSVSWESSGSLENSVSWGYSYSWENSNFWEIVTVGKMVALWEIVTLGKMWLLGKCQK